MELCLSKILGHEALGTKERYPKSNMSSVSYFRLPPLGRVQMRVTEEIRLKIGDACCSILHWAMTSGAGVVGEQRLATAPCRDIAANDLGAGRSFGGQRAWRWSNREEGNRDRELVHRLPCLVE
jgi:hypothetical protein